MKKINIKILNPIILIGVFLSCEPSEVEPISSKNTVNATIDSKSFVSGSDSANLYVSGVDSNLEVYAKSASNNVVILNMKSLKESNYTHGSEVNPLIYFTYKESIGGGGNTFSENSITGTLNITEHNTTGKYVSGTFNFETSSHKIQSGKFKQVSY